MYITEAMCLVCIFVAQNIYVSLVINMHDISLLVSWKTCGSKAIYVSTKFWLVLTTKLKQNFSLIILKLNYNKISTYLVLYIKLNLTTYNKINFYLVLKLNYN